MLEKERELTLICQAQKGSDAAKTELFLAYEKYINKTARKYANERVLLNDLIQHATIGFLEAVQNYNTSLGTQVALSTYSKNYMLSHIFECINTLHTDYRLFTTKPHKKIFSNIARYRGERSHLSKEQRELMAKDLNVDVGQIDDFERRLFAKPINLNDGFDEESTYSDIVGNDSLDPEAMVMSADYQAATQVALEGALSSLEERERYIIASRFSSDIDKKKTFKELGKELGVKHQRVDLIQKRSISALKKRMSASF